VTRKNGSSIQDGAEAGLQIDDLEQSAQACLRAGTVRDAKADARDKAASRRDHTADERARHLGEDDPCREHFISSSEDRRTAASDRERSAHERLRARADRELLAGQLVASEVDTLTGARTRAAGLAELDRELARCERTRTSLVIAYADVVGLKRRNDTDGHLAGDQLLARVAQLMSEQLRPYDLVVRLGGDEFLCAMSDMTLRDARLRFKALSRALARAPHAGAITTGFAEFAVGETAAALIGRADDELCARRRGHALSRPVSLAYPEH
jgi:diguanylate cyclase (GGDEF)-like protein